MDDAIFIFDFDGTIADTHYYICQISNRICKKYNYNLINFDELSRLRDFSAKEVIQYLEVPVLKIPAILAHAKKEFYRELDQLEPFENLKEILFELKKKVENIGILSSNSLDNIKQFLSNHGLNVFDFIQTTPKVWSKNISLKKLIQKHNFDPEKVIYIGDETRDITAAKRLGVKVAAVCWGYNSRKLLESCEPDYLLNTPEDLLTLCIPAPEISA